MRSKWKSHATAIASQGSDTTTPQFSCITHALEYLGCPSRYDVRCLCEHQNEVQRSAARCVLTNCGKDKAESILRKAKRGCAAYYACTAIPMTTTIVGIGVSTVSFPLNAVATDAAGVAAQANADPAEAEPADAAVTAAPALVGPSIVMIDD
jgi:hypothetical protein